MHKKQARSQLVYFLTILTITIVLIVGALHVYVPVSAGSLRALARAPAQTPAARWLHKTAEARNVGCRYNCACPDTADFSWSPGML